MDTPQAKIPNYEPLIQKIRTGIRKSQYFLTPNQERELSSMKGEALNPKFANLYRSGVAARDSDIRNLIRYNDISKGYNTKNRISILKSETENSKTESTILKELQTEIKIMIEIIKNSETQLLMRKIYKENK